MLLLFQLALNVDALDCFQKTEILIGRKTLRNLQLIIEPKSDMSELCKQLSGQNATVQLKIANVDSELIPVSTSLTLDMYVDSLTFTIELKDRQDSSGKQYTALDIYELVVVQNASQYTLTTLSITMESTIQTMSFTTYNASSCWSSSKLTYSLNSVNPYFIIDVEPSNCNIPSEVTAYLEYFTESTYEWKKVRIDPTTTTESNYYISSTNYVHSDVKHYVQYLKKYNDPTDMNTLYSMFTTFIEDRGIQLKLVLEAKSSGITTEFYTTISSWQGQDMDCYGNVFLYQARKNIVVNVGSRTNCDIIKSATYLNVTYYAKDESGSASQQTQTVKNDYFEGAKLLRFNLPDVWDINTSNIYYAIYLTFFTEVNGTNVYITELSYFGDTKKSCFHSIYLNLYSNRICMTTLLSNINGTVTTQTGSEYQTDLLNCLARFQAIDDPQQLVAYGEDTLLDLTTRKYYIYTTFTLPKFNSYKETFCFQESETPVHELTNGDFSTRVKNFIHDFNNKDKDRVTAIYMNDNGDYYIDDVSLVANTLHYVWIVIPAILSCVLVSIIVWSNLRSR